MIAWLAFGSYCMLYIIFGWINDAKLKFHLIFDLRCNISQKKWIFTCRTNKMLRKDVKFRKSSNHASKNIKLRLLAWFYQKFTCKMQDAKTIRSSKSCNHALHLGNGASKVEYKLKFDITSMKQYCGKRVKMQLFWLHHFMTTIAQFASSR